MNSERREKGHKDDFKISEISILKKLLRKIRSVFKCLYDRLYFPKIVVTIFPFSMFFYNVILPFSQQWVESNSSFKVRLVIATCLTNEMQSMWHSAISKDRPKEALRILPGSLGKFALKMLLLESSYNSVRRPSHMERPYVGTLASSPS